MPIVQSTITYQKQKQGFTLVETIVAVFIFSLAVVSLITISSRGLASGSAVQNETIAHNLALEGIEVVRNARDRDFLQDESWGNSFANRCDGLFGCTITYSNNKPGITLCTGPCGKLYVDANGFYDIDITSNETPFTRVIRVQTINGSEYKVTSTVTWQQRNLARSLALEEYLFNWYE